MSRTGVKFLSALVVFLRLIHLHHGRHVRPSFRRIRAALAPANRAKARRLFALCAVTWETAPVKHRRRATSVTGAASGPVGAPAHAAPGKIRSVVRRPYFPPGQLATRAPPLYLPRFLRPHRSSSVGA
jgi:hypothetical protein